MPRTTTVTQVPYDPAGNLCHHASAGNRYTLNKTDGPIWKPNEPFREVMTVNAMRSSASGKYVVLINAEGCTFPMFIIDLLELLARTTITKGVTEPLNWIVRKRGENYGIALAPDQETIPE